MGYQEVGAVALSLGETNRHRNEYLNSKAGRAEFGDSEE
jgi:hypothetical protein